jgi:hypothetical protein
MTSLRAIRLTGLKLLAAGILGTALGYWLIHKGVGLSILIVLAAPAMGTVGLALLVAPSHPADADAELGDWLQQLPRSRRIGLYAVGVLGLSLGALLVLQLGDWSAGGVFDLIS